MFAKIHGLACRENLPTHSFLPINFKKERGGKRCSKCVDSVQSRKPWIQWEQAEASNGRLWIPHHHLFVLVWIRWWAWTPLNLVSFYTGKKYSCTQQGNFTLNIKGQIKTRRKNKNVTEIGQEMEKIMQKNTDQIAAQYKEWINVLTETELSQETHASTQNHWQQSNEWWRTTVLTRQLPACSGALSPASRSLISSASEGSCVSCLFFRSEFMFPMFRVGHSLCLHICEWTSFLKKKKKIGTLAPSQSAHFYPIDLFIHMNQHFGTWILAHMCQLANDNNGSSPCCVGAADASECEVSVSSRPSAVLFTCFCLYHKSIYAHVFFSVFGVFLSGLDCHLQSWHAYYSVFTAFVCMHCCRPFKSVFQNIPIPSQCGHGLSNILGPGLL